MWGLCTVGGRVCERCTRAHTSPAPALTRLPPRPRPRARLRARAAPGYQPAIVTAFYLPYLLVPATLALHMAATPAPFGKAGGGGKGKPKRQ